MPPRRDASPPFLVLDAHADSFERVADEGLDFLTDRHSLAVSLPRMLQGGQAAQVFALFIDPGLAPGRGMGRVLELAATFHATVARSRGRLIAARTAAEVRRARTTGRIAALLSVEGGHALEDNPVNLHALAALGVTMLTLTHTRSHGWADSSQDEPRWGGLNDLGRRMVREMNRLGIVVDISHASDATVSDVLRTSRAPVIASHSCCRALCDHPRNLSDPQIRALARRGGVLCIAYFAPFLRPEAAAQFTALWHAHAKRRAADPTAAPGVVYRALRQTRLPGTLEDVCNHIEHAVSLVGPEHVGLGSDWDGAFNLPADLQNSAGIPRLIAALRRRGFRDRALRWILGGSVLRVLAGER